MEPAAPKKRAPDERATEEMGGDIKSRRTLQDGHEDDDQQEKEVEEFFAILRRLHVALQYFQKLKDEKPPPPEPSDAAASSWKPTFELQDFQDLLDGNSGFDLNSEPYFKHRPRG